MKETKLEVKLLQISENPEKIIEIAGRTAYQSFDKMEKGSEIKFVKMLLNRGHESVMEHVSMTILIKGVSRSLTHQLVRHRLASYTQLSQRYVNEENFRFITPDSIKKSEMYFQYKGLIEDIATFYKMLQDAGIKNEDARFILPNAVETEIVMTANLREWRHVLKLRGSLHAQWEIRAMAIEVYKLLKEHCPTIVSDFELNVINGNKHLTKNNK